MQNKIKIAVFVSGGGTNLQALMDAQDAGILHSGEISLVVASNPTAYALERAKKKNIPTAVAFKKELGSQEAFEAAIESALAEHQIDLIVLAGFMTILSADFPKKWCLQPKIWKLSNYKYMPEMNYYLEMRKIWEVYI